MRLAYRPLLGEWLAAWPAMLACTTGTAYILTSTIPLLTWWGGAIHATLSIAWLMQHHLADIGADLVAQPPKFTTVAFVKQRWGWRAARLPAAFYFFMAIVLAYPASLYHPGFYFSFAAGLIGIFAALSTNPRNVADITRKQSIMIGTSIVHFCLLTLYFL
jgi:1,4-dihydroxy-2-naphthoate octaprenyltransferase